MCGLIGYVSLSNTPADHLRIAKWVETAVVLDTLRGQDSTGVGIVSDPSKTAAVFKDSVPGWTFTETRRFNNVKNALSGATAVIIHNRSATMGEVTYENAHPFTVGPVTLAHNGTLTSVPKKARTGTDSEWICELIAGDRPATEVLSGLEGAFALVWHDSRDGSLNLARNQQRPLVYAVSTDGDVLVWASEEWMLHACFSRSGWREKGGIGPVREVPVGLIHKFSLHDNGPLKPRVSSFAVEQPSWYGNVGATSRTYGGTTALVPKSATANPGTNVVVLPGGLKMGQRVKFVAEEATIYQDGRATIIGPILDDTEEYVEAGTFLLTPKEWNKYKGVRDPIFEGSITGWRHDYYGKTREESSKYLHLIVSDYRYIGTYAKYVKQMEKETPKVTGGTIPGPGGILLSEEQFNTLTIDGCVTCQAPLFPVDALHDNVEWTLDQLPLCSTCAALERAPRKAN